MTIDLYVSPQRKNAGFPSPVNTSGWSSFGVYWSRRRKKPTR